MTGKKFVQNEVTKKFIELSESIVRSGTVKDYKVLGDEIGLNQSSMSSIKNGRRNLPHDIAKNFQDKYKTVLISSTQEDFMGEMYENIIAIKAAIKILVLKVIDVEARQTKRPFSEVSLDLERKVQQETKLMLDELRKRS